MSQNEKRCCCQPGPALVKAGRMVLRAAQSNQNMEQLYQVYRHHSWILFYLDAEEKKGVPVNQKDIEKRYSISRSNVSKLLKNMEKNGIITRSIDENDTRCKRLSLTTEGKRLLTLAAGEYDRLEERISRGFTQEEKEALVGYLQRIITNLTEEDN
jgi:DNA-binding MarR family transcriptional regulator